MTYVILSIYLRLISLNLSNSIARYIFDNNNISVDESRDFSMWRLLMLYSFGDLNLAENTWSLFEQLLF